MQIPVQVTFHGVPHSAEIEAIIRDRAAALEKFHGRLTGCHVVVTSIRKRAGKGRLNSVRIDLVVPGGEVIASKEHRMRPQAHQLEAAIDQAFHVARRRLEDFARRIRGSVKQHRELPIGRVSKVLQGGAAGFIKTPDGREVYFSRKAVRGKRFGRLAVGDAVNFVEEEGREGPNAAMIRPIAHAPRTRLRPRKKIVPSRVKR